MIFVWFYVLYGKDVVGSLKTHLTSEKVDFWIDGDGFFCQGTDSIHQWVINKNTGTILHKGRLKINFKIWSNKRWKIKLIFQGIGWSQDQWQNKWFIIQTGKNYDEVDAIMIRKYDEK